MNTRTLSVAVTFRFLFPVHRNEILKPLPPIDVSTIDLVPRSVVWSNSKGSGPRDREKKGGEESGSGKTERIQRLL